MLTDVLCGRPDYGVDFHNPVCREPRHQQPRRVLLQHRCHVAGLASRFVGTYMMKYVRPAVLLAVFGVCAALCTLAAILIEGMAGLYFLVAISAFMSIMFPSIYGIALEKVDERDTSLSGRHSW